MDNKEEFVAKSTDDTDKLILATGMVLTGVGLIALAMGQIKTDRNLRSVAISHLDLVRSHAADHNLLMHLSDGVEELMKK